MGAAAHIPMLPSLEQPRARHRLWLVQTYLVQSSYSDTTDMSHVEKKTARGKDKKPQEKEM